MDYERSGPTTTLTVYPSGPGQSALIPICYLIERGPGYARLPAKVCAQQRNEEPGRIVHARRTRSLDALLPVLYLRGISTGDMQEALAALLGKDAPNLSPAVLARLKAGWQEEYERWKGRDLSARRYVYIWADGVYLQASMEPDKQCILVLIGVTPEGKKELIGFQAGYRESAQSW